MEVNEITTTYFEVDVAAILWKMNLYPSKNEATTSNYSAKSFQRSKNFEFLRGTWTITAATDTTMGSTLRYVFSGNTKMNITIVPPNDPRFFEINEFSYIDGIIYWSDSIGRNFNFQPLRKCCDDCNLPTRISYCINTGDVPAGTKKLEKDEIITLNCHLTRKKLLPAFTERKQDDSPLSLSSDLEQLYVSKRLSDFKLKVGDKEFLVHKAVLAARSRVFAAMFESNMSENRQKEVKITDIEATVISDLLEYMYTGRIPPMSCEKAISLYSASDKYTLEELKGKCVDFMVANLSVSNVCVISTLADYHMDLKLKTAVKVFMRQHASEVVQSRRWKMFVNSKPYLAAEILESVVVDDFGEALLESPFSVSNPATLVETAEEVKPLCYAFQQERKND